MKDTSVHVCILEPDNERTDYHSLRVDAGALLGELVELHEPICWGQPGDLCPICGEIVELTGETTDGRLIGSCGDAFTNHQWETDEC